jgi:prophage regulatory protein
MRTTNADNRKSPESGLAFSQYLETAIHKALGDKPATFDNLTELLRQLIGKSAKAEHAPSPNPVRALRTNQVRDMTGDGRSHFYARLNKRSSSYNASFPKPFYVGKSPRWWEHEVCAWLDARDLESRKR